MRDAARDLAPRGDAFGAQELAASGGQLAGHVVERGQRGADLVPSMHGHLRVEVAARDALGG